MSGASHPAALGWRRGAHSIGRQVECRSSETRDPPWHCTRRGAHATARVISFSRGIIRRRGCRPQRAGGRGRGIGRRRRCLGGGESVSSGDWGLLLSVWPEPAEGYFSAGGVWQHSGLGWVAAAGTVLFPLQRHPFRKWDPGGRGGADAATGGGRGPPRGNQPCWALSPPWACAHRAHRRGPLPLPPAAGLARWLRAAPWSAHTLSPSPVAPWRAQQPTSAVVGGGGAVARH